MVRWMVNRTVSGWLPGWLVGWRGMVRLSRALASRPIRAELRRADPFLLTAKLPPGRVEGPGPQGPKGAQSTPRRLKRASTGKDPEQPRGATPPPLFPRSKLVFSPPKKWACFPFQRPQKRAPRSSSEAPRGPKKRPPRGFRICFEEAPEEPRFLTCPGHPGGYLMVVPSSSHVFSRVQATQGGVPKMVVPSWDHVFSRVQATQGGI